MIRLNKVNKIHDPGGPAEFQSLYDIDLHLAAGKLGVLRGISGSGKTTLLSIIGALQKPTDGEVLVDGRAVAKLPDLHASAFRSRKIGFIFQNYNLLDEFTVAENVALPLIPANYSRQQLAEKVDLALGAAHIKNKETSRVRDLSGGEKQRVAIARALVNEAQIILCDEPTANLDRDHSRSFLEVLGQLKDRGKTILVATHDPLFDNWDPVDQRLIIEAGRIQGS